MMQKQTCPYGCWPSPITPADIAAAGRKFADLKIDPAAPAVLYWNERRPEEGGRSTIMRQHPGGACEDLLAAPYSARSMVHEYGGGSFAVHAGVLWFVNGTDQALYRRDRQGAITRITSANDPARYADLQYDPVHDCLFAVAETPCTAHEPRASIVRIDAAGAVQTVAAGHDFYASPRLSPGADKLVWLAWNHPDMPWDNTELWQAAIAPDGRIGAGTCLHAGEDESLFGPLFAPDGRLFIVSDADNWWNLYRVAGARDLRQLTREQAEFGVPQWIFGQDTCAFAADGRLFALASANGFWRLGEVAGSSGAFADLAVAATHMEQLVATADGLALVLADASTAPRIARLSASGGRGEREAWSMEVVRTSADVAQDVLLSRPEPMAFPTANGDTAHALFYAPAHAEVVGPAQERPPLLIKCHGGPTGATSTALDLRIQYWTSRGYAVLDVNYRGSTGYGRAYRQKLNGAWGIADVEDCVYGARQLAADGRIDAARIVITGSSAGGYTVLSVLTFTELAAAGASYYGIADLQALLATTHKFESRYLERLIGEDPAVFKARSPLHHAECLACPVLFLQGQQDKIVPPDQAAHMAAALRARSVPVAQVNFADEGHGFRRAENISHAIAAEQSFYQQVLGLDCAEPGMALAIDNLILGKSTPG
ncbi:MAG TPA: prolyl oligopeptidase family serine peptidase [Salinisphaeraceae bacterium]|nr:prolyl oligopeptidase family serine peptidase [Salinisphaeraceae bacterium]